MKITAIGKPTYVLNMKLLVSMFCKFGWFSNKALTGRTIKNTNANVDNTDNTKNGMP